LISDESLVLGGLWLNGLTLLMPFDTRSGMDDLVLSECGSPMDTEVVFHSTYGKPWNCIT